MYLEETIEVGSETTIRSLKFKTPFVLVLEKEVTMNVRFQSIGKFLFSQKKKKRDRRKRLKLLKQKTPSFTMLKCFENSQKNQKL